MFHNPYFFGRSLRTATTNEFYYAQLKPSARLTRAAVQHDIGPQMRARYTCNRKDDGEYIVRLISQVLSVSMKTMQVV